MSEAISILEEHIKREKKALVLKRFESGPVRLQHIEVFKEKLNLNQWNVHTCLKIGNGKWRYYWTSMVFIDML